MSAKSYTLKQHGRLENTRIEQALDEIAKKEGWTLIPQAQLVARGEGDVMLTYRPDRRIDGTDVILEADGPTHFRSLKQRRKTEARDKILWEKFHLRVFHIPYSLLVAEGVGNTRAYYNYVARGIKDFISNRGLTSARLVD
jgi:hypothetical protein